MRKIAIIGNGISGATAARHIRKKCNDEITIISSESDYFFSRTALMYVFMGHMKFEHTQPYEDWFWKKNKINLINNQVINIDTDNRTLEFIDGNKVSYDTLIIATGSKPNKFGWPGENLKNVHGMYSKQDLQNLEKNAENIKQAVIVGGGLIGVELAEMLLSRNIEVTFLVRDKYYWGSVLPKEEGQMINDLIRSHHIDLKLTTQLKEIIGDENGSVVSVTTDKGEVIPCQFVGLTAGVTPNIDFVKNSKIETNRGVLVNEFLETNIENIYAIGDCAEQKNPLQNRKPLEQVWYTGRIMGETLAHTICGNKTAYQPGIWFNSAKFFDVEYQIYGWVWAKALDNEEVFYWKHPDKFISLRIVYDKMDKSVLGFNVFGIRLRHEVCEEWIRTGKTIDYVIGNLSQANFDPEFFKSYENQIQKIYSV